MSNPSLAELEQRRADVLRRLENDNLSEAEHAQVLADASQLSREISAYNRRAALDDLAGAFEVRRAGSGSQNFDGFDSTPTDTVGALVVRSAEYRALAASGFPRGKAVAVPVPWSIRTLIDSSSGQGGAFIRPPLQPVVPQLNADRQLQIIDLLDRQTTSTNSVDYVEDDTAAGAGGAAAETAEGASKPQAAFSFAQKTNPVATVAHWVPMTRQAAEDNQQLQGYVDGRLRYGLLWRVDSQVLNGNGTTPNMRGILNTSGISTYAPGTAEARVISVRKAKTLASNNEYMADGVVMCPSDWELVDLSTDANGMFRVVPNVQGDGPRRLWGMTGVETTAIASGTGLVGAFRMGATFWDRQQAQVMIGYVNDDFIKNQFTLLAELRGTVTVFRPKAFTKITFNGTV